MIEIDEIISNAEFCANEYKKFSEIAPERSLTFKKYEEDHRQLAGWLKDYKRLKEQESCEDAISRQVALDAMYELCGEGSLKDDPWRDNPHIDAITDAIMSLPPVNSQEKKWIPVSERLPEPYQNILVTVENFHFANEPVIYSVYKIKFSGDVNFIAWMPLPKPYEPQESERMNGSISGR